MSREYIITMTAENRVGILAAVTKAMAELGAELSEASQTVVSGYFTMIFAAQFPENREQQVVLDHMRDVCRPFGIDVTLSAKSETNPEQDSVQRAIKRLRISGKNVPGILRKISVTMSMSGIDIVGMHAFKEGDNGFGMVMKLSVPDSVDPTEFARELTELEPAWQMTAKVEDYQPGSVFTDEQ